MLGFIIIYAFIICTWMKVFTQMSQLLKKVFPNHRLNLSVCDILLFAFIIHLITECMVSFIHCISKRKDTCPVQQNSLGKMSNGLFLFVLTLVNGSQQRFWRSYLLCTYALCIQSLGTSCKLFVPKHNTVWLVIFMSIQRMQEVFECTTSFLSNCEIVKGITFRILCSLVWNIVIERIE